MMTCERPLGQKDGKILVKILEWTLFEGCVPKGFSFVFSFLIAWLKFMIPWVWENPKPKNKNVLYRKTYVKYLENREHKPLVTWNLSYEVMTLARSFRVLTRRIATANFFGNVKSRLFTIFTCQCFRVKGGELWISESVNIW